MIKRIEYIYLLLVGLIFIGCEEKIDWKFPDQESGNLVVESIITDEYKKHEILLSLSQASMGDESMAAIDADIKLISHNDIYTFTASQSFPGSYESDKSFAAKLNINYQLEINWNNEKYLAQSYMIQVIPSIELTFKSKEGTDSMSINENIPFYSPYEQVMYEIDIDWSHIINEDSAKAKVFYYTFNTIDVNEIFRPEKQTVLFPKGSIIIVKKYSLNPEMANYYRAMLMETEWQGGVFDEAASSLPTNISNGGLGFFGVSAVLSDTLVAE